jgi:hypothetical protein
MLTAVLSASAALGAVIAAAIWINRKGSEIETERAAIAAIEDAEAKHFAFLVKRGDLSACRAFAETWLSQPIGNRVTALAMKLAGHPGREYVADHLARNVVPVSRGYVAMLTGANDALEHIADNAAGRPSPFSPWYHENFGEKANDNAPA